MIPQETSQNSLSASNHSMKVTSNELLTSLSGFAQLNKMIATNLSEHELYLEALGILIRSQNCESCAIYLLEGDRLELAAETDWEMILGTGSQEGRAACHRDHYSMGEGCVGFCAKSQTVINWPDLGLMEGTLTHNEHGFLPESGSAVCAPMRFGKEVIGAIKISHSDTHFFNEWHNRFLHIFANFFGHAVINKRRLNQMENEIEQRTAQVREALLKAEELKRKFERLSVIDDLTGLYNRRHFFPESEGILAQALRYNNAISLITLDIDFFKKVNDNYGHATGDEVLKDTAQAIQNQLRVPDILARMGGEEFSICCPETDADGAKKLALRISNAVKALRWTHEGKTVLITISIGIASASIGEIGKSSHSIESLLHQSDLALYQSKEDGRDRTTVYSSNTLIAC